MKNQSSVLVSVIIPVFNAEQYLRPCLESVMSQSLREIEIICVNDGSNDKSLSILQEYAEKDRRFIIIDKKNEGQAIARNIALSHVSGEYVVFVDSDDHVDLDLCRKVYHFAKKHNCDMVIYDFTSFINIDELSKTKKDPSSLSVFNPSDRKALLKQMGVVWIKCVRTDFIRLNMIRFPEGRIYEDVFVHWQLIILARNPGIMPEKLYHYRIQPSATTLRNDWKITDRIFIFDMIRDFLISRSLYDEYQEVFLQLQMNAFCGIYDNIDFSCKKRVMELIRNRLLDEHWSYLDISQIFTWRARDFYRAIQGSYSAKARRAIWSFTRECYRFMKKIKRLSLY